MNPFQPLKNAKNTLLSQRPGTTPDVTGGINNYFRPLVFQRIRKETVNAQLIETVTTVQTVGFMTPGKRTLDMKTEGQRKWNKWALYTIPSFELNMDDRVVIVNLKKGDTPYRVMGKTDYSDSGYILYDLVEDYDYALAATTD